MLWLVHVGTSTLDMFLFEPMRIVVPQYPTGIINSPAIKHYCILINIRPKFAVISALGTLIYDTAVFLAISYRLTLVNNHLNEPENLGDKTRTFFSGRRMLWFSRRLLQDGQAYYLWVSLETMLNKCASDHRILSGYRFS